MRRKNTGVSVINKKAEPVFTVVPTGRCCVVLGGQQNNGYYYYPYQDDRKEKKMPMHSSE